jgi:hypothetical protein
VSNRREKPDSATETARVLRIFDMLREELGSRFGPPDARFAGGRGSLPLDHPLVRSAFEIADRIAYRTEEP